MQKSLKSGSQDLRQVWFPGKHDFVGGGTEKHRGLSDAALLWMMNEASNFGLEFDQIGVEDGIHPDHTINFDNEPDIFYQLTGKLLRNITGSFDDLHESVKNRWRERKDYRPENLRKFQDSLEAYSKQ